MTPEELESRYALNPFTLGYLDPEMEADYRRYQPGTLARSVRPVLLGLTPLLALLSLLDYLAVTDVELISWRAGMVIVVAFSGLLVLISSQVSGHLVQMGLLASFLLVGGALLMEVSNAEELARYFPGFFIVVMMGHFIGLRFTYALIASGLLLVMLLGVVAYNDIGATTLLNLCVFLVPGYAIAATAGYTMERQRRRLYAQIKLMEYHSDRHERMALHDPLTELPNRNLLRERMEQALARVRRQHGQFAVLFVDLDDFKTVNDNYGHGIGDQVLKQIADNLRHHIRGEDTVARVGGDEFVVLSEHINEERGARIAADRIHNAVSTPIVVHVPQRADTIHVHVTCSIGISLCPRDGDALDILIDRADEAMYQAKREGKSTSRFYRTTEDEVSDAESSAG
jgi:diguanylate cyclase (GGDEF)-like protein